MEDFFRALDVLAGSGIALVTIVVGLFPIFWVSWAVWRHLHHTKRIANALEHMAYQRPIQDAPALAVTHEQGKEARGRILNSAFGR